MFGLPVRRLPNSIPPFGYDYDPDRPEWLMPVQKELEALYLARKYYKRSSYAQLADWVTKETGKAISAWGLWKIFQDRPPLEIYLLPLDVRYKLITAETEEQAPSFAPKTGFSTGKRKDNFEKYCQLAAASVKRAEKARRDKATKIIEASREERN